MELLSLELADGTYVDGREYVQLNSALKLSSESVPLLVLVHGGSYDCDFFDLDERHSVRQWSKRLGVPTVALNRPGYGRTPALTKNSDAGSSNSDSETYIQRHGRWLNELALPALWSHYSKALSVSSIVLYGSSIGGAVSTVAAGLHGRDPSPGYKLAGLILSAMGATPNAAPLKPFYAPLRWSSEPLVLPREVQESLAASEMASLFDKAVFETDKGRHPTSGQELYDINIEWPTYWRAYANTVRVQVLYTLGEVDDLWHVSPSKVHEFVGAFSNAPWVESRLLINAPHVPEFSRQCSGFLLRVYGFALECAASLAIQEEKRH
jgi:pimeloyl-ACP methyl ester carboxylesterase